MAIIDFHSHILPDMDDGSDSVGKSLHMCSICAVKGVDMVVATPHFYAWRDRVEPFLERRAYAYQSLCAELRDQKPELRLGAETAYFHGISDAEKITQLTIEGTDVLLLELPFEAWDDTVFQEVEALIEDRGLTVMLAHLERYLSIPGNKKQMKRIMELPVHVQLNAGSLLDWRRRRKTIKLFRKSTSHFLGSDMHGTTRRPPNLMEGREILQNEFGKEFLDQMDAAGEKLLGIR